MKYLAVFFPIVLFASCGVSTRFDRELFRGADTNGDARLSFEEANRFELARVFKDVDFDRDGKVTFAEASEIHPDFDRKQFRLYDLNGNGVVVYDEFYQAQTKKGGVRLRFTAADTNKDDFVTLKEADERVKWLMDQAESGW
jgi:EF hand